MEILNTMKIQLLVKMMIIFIIANIYSYIKNKDNNDDCNNK